MKNCSVMKTLVHRTVITSVGRGLFFLGFGSFLSGGEVVLSSELVFVLISSVWHEGGAVAPPV